jgi:RNA polymerase sigma-70 factor (ECF subfamily)
MMARVDGLPRPRHPASAAHETPAGAPGAPALRRDLTAEIELAQKGDEAAFREIYRSVQPGLLRYLRGLVADDAEDVASETWGQVARDLAGFRGDDQGFRGWVARIGRNRALDHLRYVRRRPVAAATTVDDLVDSPGPDDTAGSALEIVSTESAIAMIASLPADQAEAVLLRVVMGLDVATTAHVLGKRAGAVRTAAHRGLRRLASLIGEEPVDAE